MDFESHFNHYRDRAEAALIQWTPAPDTRPIQLHQAMRYSLEAGGKRIRPVLVLACADLFDQAIDPSPAAAAVEILHTYTLIHDDLPAMDDSPLRRGRPSAHVAFDEATAVLAGDALLTEAFAILANGYSPYPETGIRLVSELATAAGSQRLIGGQAEDTAAEHRQISPQDLEYIHLNKTAALLEACCRMGAICGNATEQQLTDLTQAARAVGLAFQILDDILDVTATESAMGKTVRNDAARAKNTYVALHGLDHSQSEATRLTHEALEGLESFGPKARFLETLFRKLLERKN